MLAVMRIHALNEVSFQIDDVASGTANSYGRCDVLRLACELFQLVRMLGNVQHKLGGQVWLKPFEIAVYFPRLMFIVRESYI